MRPLPTHSEGKRPSPDEAASILWTGGWDSTFQLLQLLLLHQRPVIPYYLINEDRGSTGIELATMRDIRLALARAYPHTEALLAPTRFFSVSCIGAHPEITDTYRRVRQQRFLGTQYEWLPRFCEEQGISNLQLCIHKDDKAHTVIGDMTRPAGEETDTAAIVDERFSGSDEYRLFHYFTFPILELTKPDMAEQAKSQGWESLMGMTWFCHKPRKNQPCGLCNPCRYTIEEGLGWRIPRSRRYRRHLAPIINFPRRCLYRSLAALRR